MNVLGGRTKVVTDVDSGALEITLPTTTGTNDTKAAALTSLSVLYFVIFDISNQQQIYNALG